MGLELGSSLLFTSPSADGGVCVCAAQQLRDLCPLDEGFVPNREEQETLLYVRPMNMIHESHF